jgi:hypothetical protein
MLCSVFWVGLFLYQVPPYAACPAKREVEVSRIRKDVPKKIHLRAVYGYEDGLVDRPACQGRIFIVSTLKLLEVRQASLIKNKYKAKIWASNGVCMRAMTWVEGNTFSSRADIDSKGCTENKH